MNIPCAREVWQEKQSSTKAGTCTRFLTLTLLPVPSFRHALSAVANGQCVAAVDKNIRYDLVCPLHPSGVPPLIHTSVLPAEQAFLETQTNPEYCKLQYA
jgi:hypothetical protein